MNLKDYKKKCKYQSTVYFNNGRTVAENNAGIDLTVLRDAFELWGKEKQVYITVEELAELQKELLKNVNRGENNRDHILEELADVFVTCECLKMIYDFREDDINAEMRRKVERLKGRIIKARAEARPVTEVKE